MSEQYIWWKEIMLGPFFEEEIQTLRMDRVEILVDSALKNGFPKCAPLNKNMEDNPNVPHIVRKKQDGDVVTKE